MMQKVFLQSITLNLCILVMRPCRVSRKLALQAALRPIDEKEVCTMGLYDCTFGGLLTRIWLWMRLRGIPVCLLRSLGLLCYQKSLSMVLVCIGGKKA
jgi:hypothetical protein